MARSNTGAPAGTSPDPSSPSIGPRANGSAFLAAGAGSLAAAVALAVGEFAASVAAPRPGPVIAVANRVIDKAPGWFVSFGKDVFGLADKPALMIGTVVIAVVIGAGLGLASRRNPLIGIVGFVGFGVVGLLAVGVDAQAGWGAALWINAVAVLAGIAALSILLPRASGRGRSPSNRSPQRRLPVGVTDSPTDPAVGRRSFLGAAGLLGAGAVAAGMGARSLRSRSNVEAARLEAQAALSGVTGDGAAAVQASIESVAVSDVAITPGITPIVVQNTDFYRIDTALIVPQVDPTNWTLTIGGMVEQVRTYTYAELIERSTTIEPVTLSCVSNEVGGGLVGNAVWQGVPLAELLDEAGILPGATQIKSTSVDGWDCGFPTDLAYDGRTALLAVGMNDEPLPVQHGFPARLVIAGLYGYVSATKWIESIELTTLEDFDGYWIPRGWSKLGPVKTQSRIDTPRRGSSVPSGVVPLAGVAWAPNVGIERVEVRIDEGDWIEATLGESLGVNAWRQWVLRWNAEPGSHRVEVRATDGSGETQTELRTPVAPDGASGWHTIDIDVT